MDLQPLASNEYALGHAQQELDRLIAQDRFIGDLTEHVLRQAGLKTGMRVLDVGFIPQLKIGQMEVEWMAANWPKLERLKGLFAKETVKYDRLNRMIEVDFQTAKDEIRQVDVDKANEQGYIQWLHKQRPDIIMT